MRTRGDEQPRQRLDRRSYGLLAAAFALFAIYGSLVPFDVRPLSLAGAWAEFSSVLFGPLNVESRTDFVTNVLLFIPLGYLMLAALGTDRSGRVLLGPATLFTIGSCLTLSAAIEFAQTWVPDRTVALSDIVAETVGASIGVSVWLVAGEAVTRQVRAFLATRQRPGLRRQLLVAYCVGFCISQTLPLDLTINVSELARKYRHGMIELRPFVFRDSSWLAATWSCLTSVALSVPIGIAAVLLWTERSRRRASSALVLGVGVIAALEMVQVFVASRVADVTDVITGSVGVAIGVAAAARAVESDLLDSVRRRPHRVVVVARGLTALWIGVLLIYHWSPFDFSLDPAQVTAGAHRIVMVPLHSYFIGTPFHALGEMVRKSLIAAPLGALMRSSWPDDRLALRGVRSAVTACAGFCLLLAIEVGQVFLPTRVPDITDAMVGEAGVVAGIWIAGLIAAARRPEGVVQPSTATENFAER